MRETERLDEQLRRMTEGGSWHGPSLREILAGLEAERAAARPIAGAHSIWELVNHITAWRDIVRRRIAGEAVEVTPEVDWPPVRDVGAGAWQDALSRLDAVTHELRAAVRSLDDERLHRPIEVGSGTTNLYDNVAGLLQHDGWHGGQIAILRRALALAPSS